MPVITYTSVDRGRLASGHSDATEYKIEASLQGFPITHAPAGDIEETLSGAPEGWLDNLAYEYPIRSDLVYPADLEDWREFFDSVVAGEVFTVDFTGTIASPGTHVSVYLKSRRIIEEQRGGAGFQFTFTVKTV